MSEAKVFTREQVRNIAGSRYVPVGVINGSEELDYVRVRCLSVTAPGKNKDGRERKHWIVNVSVMDMEAVASIKAELAKGLTEYPATILNNTMSIAIFDDEKARAFQAGRPVDVEIGMVAVKELVDEDSGEVIRAAYNKVGIKRIFPVAIKSTTIGKGAFADTIEEEVPKTETPKAEVEKPRRGRAAVPQIK